MRAIIKTPVNRLVYEYQTRPEVTETEINDFVRNFNKAFPEYYKKYLEGKIDDNNFGKIATIYTLINYPATYGIVDALKRTYQKIKNGYHSTGNSGYWERLGEWLYSNDHFGLGIFIF